MKKRLSSPLFPVLLLIPIIFSPEVVAQYQAAVPDESNTRTNQYYSVRTVALPDGTNIDEIVINGPPTPPPGYIRPAVVQLPEPSTAAGVNTLSEVPAFNWSFGCSATSAAMIAGYYDRHGYANMYAGPTNGGVMPLDNSSWPNWIDGSGATRHQCPLSATHNGLDGRVTNGHVDDYWVEYGSSDPDPFIGNWTEHTYGECTGDYMKTNQSNYGNSDGSTTFYNYTNGLPLPWDDMEGYGIHTEDGGYGFKLFYESRGYTVTNMYNQYIYGYKGNTLGFTYSQYCAEIDAGRPVMIHVEGHTMVGLGYDDASNLMYIHDTWDYNTYTMTWGGTYYGMQHYAVTIVQIAEPEIDVTGLGNSIPDGDTTPSTTDDTDFGTVTVGNTQDHIFTIHNTGGETLQLDGSPTVQISGSSDFTVTSQPASTSLASGGSTTFTVRFAPSGTGISTATISIDNTDLNEDPYDFLIQGTGTAAPEMDVQGGSPSVSIADGDNTPSTTDDTDFGTTNVNGGTVDHIFTIQNVGSADLNLTATPPDYVTISGTHASDFSVTAQPSTPVTSGGGTTTFTVQFDPSDTGLRTATINIANDDDDENPYDFAIQGSGADGVLVQTKIWLEGPYQAGGSMTTLLKTGGHIPTTSPYADSRFVSPIPDGVTDWIFVELRNAPTGAAVSQRSFFLKSNGLIVDDDGATTDLRMPGASDDSYYIVVTHRNHLAVMSASTQALDWSSSALYDFTVDEATPKDKYYGADAKELETGVYGMYTGDANSNGQVQNDDKNDYWKVQVGTAGYKSADFNLNGEVQNDDKNDYWKSNVGKGTQVP